MNFCYTRIRSISSYSSRIISCFHSARPPLSSIVRRMVNQRQRAVVVQEIGKLYYYTATTTTTTTRKRNDSLMIIPHRHFLTYCCSSSSRTCTGTCTSPRNLSTKVSEQQEEIIEEDNKTKDNHSLQFLNNSNNHVNNFMNLDLTQQECNNVNILRQAWPQLKHQFDSYTNQDGLFPILEKEQQQLLDKQVLQKKKKLRNMKKYINGNIEDEENNEIIIQKDRSAVLVLICSVNNVPSILFTRRSKHLNNHATEIAFPGGHYEYNIDQNDIDTAIRETIEELIPAIGNTQFVDNITIIGQATKVTSLKGKLVTPIIGIYWKNITIPTTENDSNTNNKNQYDLVTEFPGNPDEVDSVFSIPITTLLQTESIYPIPKQQMPNRFGLTYTPMFPSKYGTIWGLTAFILRPLLHRVLKPIFVVSSSSQKLESNKNIQ